MKFTLIDEEPDKPKKKVKIVRDTQKKKDNEEAYFSWTRFKEKYIPLYEMKIKNMDDNQFMNELILIFHELGNLYIHNCIHSAEKIMGKQMDYGGWSVINARETNMLRVKSEIVEHELRIRQLTNILHNQNQSISTERLKYYETTLNSFAFNLDNIYLDGLSMCKDCNKGTKLFRNGVEEFRLLIKGLIKD